MDRRFVSYALVSALALGFGSFSSACGPGSDDTTTSADTTGEDTTGSSTDPSTSTGSTATSSADTTTTTTTDGTTTTASTSTTSMDTGTTGEIVDCESCLEALCPMAWAACQANPDCVCMFECLAAGGQGGQCQQDCGLMEFPPEIPPLADCITMSCPEWCGG